MKQNANICKLKTEMKRITLLFFLLLTANKIFAQQPCNDDIIMAVKGKWVTSPDNFTGSDKTFPASQYSQIKTRLDKMAALFKDAYPQPEGMEKQSSPACIQD